ncbi:response regulator [Sansalvadorimonas verongulae]|uniref:response regulator n=1 Tax=Sansalvadorimonas verongulae TaxID=2172824 RepID=UPI0012BC6FF2|nr:response regulator [Sansalvadorimonas verongulae]MTI14214.1 response regulator [Sansalvadorimonas verongulae]
MFSFSKLSIERKLRYAMMTTAEVGLLVSLIVYSVSDYSKSKDAMMERIQTLAEVFAMTSEAAVYFHDVAAGNELLHGLDVVSSVEEAYLLLPNGQKLASYTRSDNQTFTKLLLPPGKRTVEVSDDWLDVARAIEFEGQPIGTIVIRASLEPLSKQITLNIMAALMITILAIIISYLAAYRMQRIISNPITALAEAMRQVSSYQLFSHRLEKTNDDEIGQLYERFNEMMDLVHRRDEKLNKHKDELENTVQLRTEALNMANENLREAIEEANVAKEAALDAAKAKSSFLANMSHEIRTPMNGVLGMLELLRDTRLEKSQKDYLETAYGSADALLQIINDILDFSKIEAGKLELEQIDMSPSSLADDVSALLASRAREKKIELGCYTDVKMPAAVKGDPVRLRQVLTNLLGNAVKFTESGEVVVRALYKGTENNQHTILFEVEDTGIGIPEEVVPTLFQPFTQADGSTTRKFGGTGLGLTISRQLVEIMGGELQVSSKLGEGSKFYFEIKMGISDGADLPKHYETMDLSNIYALVVDDNPTNREIMHRYLEAWGIDHALAEGGPQALDKMHDAVIAGRPFQLVYLDMQMPEMDGITLSKAIANDKDLGDCRRIMLTSAGHLCAKEQKEAMLHGSLAKPFRQSQLLDLTMEVMNKHTATEPVPVKKTVIKTTFEDKYDLLLVEDNPVNQKVARAMLKKLGITRVDLAVNGLEAVEMTVRKNYSLVLMDCQMPEMSGYEATRAIRKRENETGAERHSIIAMTANAMEGDREKCLEAGMDDYISKPVKSDALGEILSRWLEADSGE